MISGSSSSLSTNKRAEFERAARIWPEPSPRLALFERARRQATPRRNGLAEAQQRQDISYPCGVRDVVAGLFGRVEQTLEVEARPGEDARKDSEPPLRRPDDVHECILGGIFVRKGGMIGHRCKETGQVVLRWRSPPLRQHQRPVEQGQDSRVVCQIAGFEQQARQHNPKGVAIERAETADNVGRR